MKFFKILTLATATYMFGSCANFDEINTNPDASTQVSSKLLATSAIAGLVKPTMGAGYVDHMFISKYIAWGEGARGAQYNDFYRTGFGSYVNLTDYQLMADLASESDKNAYEGLAHFLKAYTLFDLTMAVGDIPCSEILQGEMGILTPKYDSQKDVCLYILQELDSAYEKMSQANNFEGDFVFGGNANQWSKIITAYHLRVLMHLSIKEKDADLKVEERFRNVYNRKMLMESNADNLQLTFSDKSGQFFPFHSSNNKHWAYAMVSDYLVNMLKENQDYRLFYYAKPCQTKVDEGVNPASWDAFVGVDPTAPISDVREAYATSNCSGLNARYIDYIPGEPFIRIGYSEQNFILAEAALRGWIKEDPSYFYKKAIRGSFDFINENTPDDEIYHYGNKLTEEIINTFLANPNIQLTGNFETDLELIMKQKYIASFMQLPWMPYYDYRRTGLPKFPINPETSLNFNAPDKIPVRWQYPDSEISYNKANVEEAIQRQYGGADEVNKLMWILQK